MSNGTTDNYTLGKGKVYFDQLVNGVYQGELYLGNAPELSFNMSLEKLDHYSSTGGTRTKDKTVVIEVTPTMSLTLDEISSENMALLTLGEKTLITQVADSITGETVKGYLGKRIKLANRNIDPATVVVTKGVTALTVDVDYKIDTTAKDDKIGRILILEDGGTVVDGDDLIIDYDTLGATYNKISGIKNTTLEGRFRYVSDNPVGAYLELFAHRGSVTPSGDTALIGDDWSTLALSVEILGDKENNPTSPYFDMFMDED